MILEMTHHEQAFFEAGLESLAEMERLLLSLIPDAANSEAIHAVFRVTHSLKGGSAMFGFAEITSFAHTLETVLDALRSERLAVRVGTIDLLLKSTDVLRGLMLATQRRTPVDQQLMVDVQFDLELLVAQGVAPGPDITAQGAPVEPGPDETAVAWPVLSGVRAAAPDTNSLRVASGKIDALMNSVSEIDLAHAALVQAAQDGEAGLPERLRAGLDRLERHVRELQESLMHLRMLPISSTFERFPRLVRDLSQRLGKRIELRMTGGQTEFDKTVLERIADPLVHLVRNAVDHGVELPATRVEAGKPPVGTVFLDARYRGGSVVIEVGDDGAGLDLERILATARARGLVGPHEVLDEAAIANLTFLPGLSTVEVASDLSGRGVGMDVVRRNIEDLGGSVELRSHAGHGASVAIVLPLTRALFDGQCVSVGEETFIVPSANVVELLQPEPAMLSRLVGGGELLAVRGTRIPLLRLRETFAVRPRPAGSGPGQAGSGRGQGQAQGLVLVVESAGQRAGLLVDEVLERRQVEFKPPETRAAHAAGIAGTAALSAGCQARILDVDDLLRMAAEQGRSAPQSAFNR